MTTPAELFAAIDAGDADAVAALLAEDPSLAAARDPDLVSATMHALYRGHPRSPSCSRSRCRSWTSSRPQRSRVRPASGRSLDDGRVARPRRQRRRLHGAPLPGVLRGRGAAEVAELLLDAGADVNARSANDFDVLPLHSACAGNHDEVVAVLIAAGADVNARQSGGYTPLHGAAQNGADVTVDRLLAAGADRARPERRRRDRRRRGRRGGPRGARRAPALTTSRG